MSPRKKLSLFSYVFILAILLSGMKTEQRGRLRSGQ